MEPQWRDWVGIAVIVPIVTMAAVFFARRSAKWFVAALEHSFGLVVLNVMAPDMARIGTRIAASLDELRISNTADHIATGQRLAAVEERQTDVETRLAAVENRLQMRPPDLRTRITDIDGAHNG